MSALDRRRWPQNGARFLGYVDFEPLRLASGTPLLRRGALLRELQCHALADAPRPVCPSRSPHSWSPTLPRAALCGSAVWPPLLLARPMPRQPLSLVRAAGSWWVSTLSWRFPSSGNPPLHVAIPCTAAEHACTRADRLSESGNVNKSKRKCQAHKCQKKRLA